jgi:GNAT superfamily N-acetyltransferase
VEAARLAVAADIPELAKLSGIQAGELAPMRGGHVWSAKHLVAPPVEGTLAALLASPTTTVVVGTVDDVVLGFGILQIDTLRTGERLAVIAELFVDEGAREIGVGEEILEMLLTAARDAGCIGVDAGTLPGHRATKNFFETAGFTARAIVMHHALSAETDGGVTDGAD